MESPRHWEFFPPDVGKEEERKEDHQPRRWVTGKERKERSAGERGTRNTRTKLFWRTRFPIELQPEDDKKGGSMKGVEGGEKKGTHPPIP